MKETNWMEKLMETARCNPRYQEKLDTAKNLEADFLALRDSLQEPQRQTLEAYLSACEELDHELLCTAVCLFREN